MNEARSVHVVIAKADHAHKLVEDIKSSKVDVICLLHKKCWDGIHSQEAQD